MGCGVGGGQRRCGGTERKREVGGRCTTGRENGKPKKRRSFTLTPLRTWEVCGGSALTLGLNLSETPGLANLLEGWGGGIHFL